MNLGDLQSARSKERQKDSLQHLRADFYTDVGTFVAELRTERERAAEAAEDPFDAPEVRRLTDDIKTAENTVEAIYERRVGKLVKLASLAAAGMPAEREGLTAEETDLFETLVEAIESNRAHVLDDVLAGESMDDSDATPSDGAEPTAEDGGVEPSSPDKTGSDARPDGSAVDAETATGAATPTEADGGVSAADAMAAANEPPANDTDATPAADEPAPAASTEADRAPAGADDAGGETPNPDTERTTVRITRDVGEVFGVDEHTYHLSAEDIVTLPEVNATPLLERDAAEKLD